MYKQEPLLVGLDSNRNPLNSDMAALTTQSPFTQKLIQYELC